jgi:hypothetical protein
MWWPFRPKHTLVSVAKDLIEGLENGSIVLPWSDNELDLQEEFIEIPFTAPAIAEGPFKRYAIPPVTTPISHQKKRATSEAVRVPGLLVASGNGNKELPGYAQV